MILRQLVITLVLLGCASSNHTPKPVATADELLDQFQVSATEREKFEFKPKPKPKSTPVVVVKKDKSTATPAQAPVVNDPWPENYPDEFKDLKKKALPTWNQFQAKVKVGEKKVFKISFLGVTVGTIEFQTLPTESRNEEDVFHFYAKLSSADYYKYIYSLDDYVESFVSAENFLPLKYTLVQRESSQNVDELQLFDWQTYAYKQWYKKEKNGQTREDNKSGFLPPLVVDPLALLSFFRGLPLNLNDEYFIPTLIRGKLWRVEAKVVAGESDGNVKLQIQAKPQDPKKKTTSLNLWYEKGDTRRLLKFEADLKFGSVSGELLRD